MKIHTNNLTTDDILNCVPENCYLAPFIGDGPGISYSVIIDEVGSRSHDRAFVVRLSGSGKSTMQNLGDKAATWDEWGWFLAEIFKREPDAICGHYKGVTDFNIKTDRKFVLDTVRW